MKKLPLIIIAIVILIGLSVLYFFLPVDKWLSQTPLLKELYNNSSLSITSRNSKASVEIDGKKYGETPLNLNDLSEGNHNIAIKRISDSEGFYQVHSYSIELIKNTEAIIDIEIGPDDIASGYLLYYSQSPDTDKGSGYISITSDKLDSSVYLGSDFIGKAPVSTKKIKTGKYQLQITSDGCEAVEFPIIVRNGYILNINTMLIPIPINLQESSQ